MRNEQSTEWAKKKNGPTAQVQEEFTILMSLALDNLLDSEERTTFDAYLASYPTLADEWLEWQALDAALDATPSVAPPVNFLANFETRLAQKERRRHLWWGVGFGAVAVVLWAAAIIGVASLGAFVLLSQPAWLTQTVHNLAFAHANVTGWVAAATATAGAVAGTAEARTFGLVYMLLSASLVTAWVFFLRHSTRQSAFVQPV